VPNIVYRKTWHTDFTAIALPAFITFSNAEPATSGGRLPYCITAYDPEIASGTAITPS
jgi:hypothetical protein